MLDSSVLKWQREQQGHLQGTHTDLSTVTDSGSSPTWAVAVFRGLQNKASGHGSQLSPWEHHSHCSDKQGDPPCNPWPQDAAL